MKPTGPTLPFNIRLKTGETIVKEATSLEELIANEFENEKEFKHRVEKVGWKKKSTLMIYDAETDQTESFIADGDVNPYGWRMQHR